MNSRSSNRAGSTLLTVLLMIAVLAMVIGAYYQTLGPRFRSTYQGSSWQEALHGAEAGADLVIRQLNTWAATIRNPDAYPWTDNQWAPSDAAYSLNGLRTLAESSLPVLGGTNNVRVVSLGIDVYTRETIGSAPTGNPWFRIRSTARADLPGRYVGTDSRDTRLRRMKLGSTRFGRSDPHVTRTVEVIVRPRYRFSRAITTVTDLTLGNSHLWEVDSFDSSDPKKSDPGTSAGGVYPASTPSEIQANGNIGSGRIAPSDTPYGPLIAGNGAAVKGEVQTFGGDDPNTSEHENVSGNQNMDQNRIRADFDDDITPIAKPAWTYFVSNPPGNTTFTPSTSASDPARYIVSGNLETFSVAEPPADKTGYVEILVTGHLDPGNAAKSGITIPPNVFATVYVEGDIEFGNGTINTNSSSSKVASHLSIIGVGPFGTFKAAGNTVQTLTFYGPSYDALFAGTVETHGAIVAKSFRIYGGGAGGFHFDEALGRGGDIIGWQLASYFEDVRSDL